MGQNEALHHSSQSEFVNSRAAADEPDVFIMSANTTHIKGVGGELAGRTLRQSNPSWPLKTCKHTILSYQSPFGRNFNVTLCLPQDSTSSLEVWVSFGVNFMSIEMLTVHYNIKLYAHSELILHRLATIHNAADSLDRHTSTSRFVLPTRFAIFGRPVLAND